VDIGTTEASGGEVGFPWFGCFWGLCSSRAVDKLISKGSNYYSR